MLRRRMLLGVAVVLALLAFASSAGAVPEPPTGQIDLLAGTVAGYFPPGDNFQAIVARVNGPTDVAAMPDGSVLIADGNNNRVRRVSPAGVITTVAGNGTAGYTGDNGPATSATINGPTAVASTGDGGFLIADTNNRVVRRVSAAGTITTAAGTGADCASALPGPCGDGSAATSALLSFPTDVAATPDGGYLISDLGVHVIRKVDATGTISRVAGNYSTPLGGFGGDGGPATAPAAQLDDPYGVAPTPDGGFLIADSANHRIRKVAANGVINTVAGTGTSCPGGTCGDGGTATAAQLNLPHGVAARPDGSYYISDSGDNRVRRVDSGGTITNAAGDPASTAGSVGDGGPATSAQMSDTRGIDQCGNTVIVADFGNNRVRWFGAPPVNGTSPCTPQPAPAPAPSGGGSSGGGTTTTAPVTPTNAIAPLAIAPPVLGVSVDATPIAGVVLVRLPGQKDFTPLAAGANLPMGTEYDTTKGTVTLAFVNGVADPHSADVSKGLFQTQQGTATGSALNLNLTGKLSGCPRGGRASAAAVPPAVAAKAKKSSRQVKTKANGPVKTKGRYGAATVRGTAWTIKDTCSRSSRVRSGTLVTVTEGTVAVSDQVKHKTVLVKAGKRYFIAARGR